MSNKAPGLDLVSNRRFPTHDDDIICDKSSREWTVAIERYVDVGMIRCSLAEQV